MDNFNALVSGIPQKVDMVNDGWTDIIGNMLALMRKQNEAGDGKMDLATTMQLADFKKMEEVRARAQAVVKDPDTAEALKPYYNQFCKRPCFHDEYLDTFNRPNVTLVDTDGRGVDRITEKGVVANGREYDLDCLIYGTGFEVGTSYTRRSGYELYGRDGQSLTDKWKDGVSTLHGMHARGFPNVFIVSNTQSGFTANFPHMLNEQSRHIAYIVKTANDRQATVVEASEEAENAWVQTIVSSALMRQRFQEECTPGYYNNEGKPSPLAARNGSYGLGPIAFIKLREDWRAQDRLEGLVVTRD
jgi:cyclohexanone monooxygenase